LSTTNVIVKYNSTATERNQQMSFKSEPSLLQNGRNTTARGSNKLNTLTPTHSYSVFQSEALDTQYIR